MLSDQLIFVPLINVISLYFSFYFLYLGGVEYRFLFLEVICISFLRTVYSFLTYFSAGSLAFCFGIYGSFVYIKEMSPLFLTWIENVFKRNYFGGSVLKEHGYLSSLRNPLLGRLEGQTDKYVKGL